MTKKQRNDEKIELLKLYLDILNINRQFILVDDLTKDKLENISIELGLFEFKYKKMLLIRELIDNETI